jgi:predicted nucleic acid-binding protein
MDGDVKHVEADAVVPKVRHIPRWCPVRDTLIAGIVISRRAELATRNLRHFDDLEIAVVDPWAA